jgi:transcriptional regulator with XRE-family HTH domain
MSPAEFVDIRHLLGLTQPELAKVLGYAHHSRVAAFESASSGRVVPPAIERLMRAYEAGYRPPGWPRHEVDAGVALKMLG